MLLTKYPRIWYHIQVPGGADSPASLWRDVRAVEGTGLENRRRASVRGFESHSLRQFNIDLRKYPRGRRGSPAKGVGWLKPARGFKSLLPRHVVVDCISFATTFSFSKQTSSLTHSVAPPFQITTAPLGCDLGQETKISGVKCKKDTCRCPFCDLLSHIGLQCLQIFLHQRQVGGAALQVLAGDIVAGVEHGRLRARCLGDAVGN